MFKKKFLILLIFILAISFVLAETALGQQAPDRVLDGLGETADQAQITKGSGSLPAFVGGVINYSFAAIAAIFVTVIMLGGFLWMTARGNEDKVAKAKTFILNGLFGLIVVFLAYGLVYVILFALGEAIGTI